MPYNINNSDYLLRSGFNDINAKALNNLNSWDKALADPATTVGDKQLIHRFFKPYKISLLKFILNKDCYEKSTYLDDVTDKHEVAPSLRKIIDAPFEYKVLAYPDWFYIAFPDVVIWCIDGDGKQLLRDKLRLLTEEEAVEDGHLNPSILKTAIELYFKHTQNLLECQIYSGHEHLASKESLMSRDDMAKGEITQASGGKNSNCYIATVCYGDINAAEVQLLRKFRDERLAQSSLGMVFINLYYRISPNIAKQLEGKTNLNTIIRRHVLDRIVKYIQ